MRFRTKFGAISVSDDTGKEFERLARVPLTHARVEAIISSLSDKQNTPQEQIDQAVIASGKSDYEELQELDNLAQNNGLNIDYGITGLSLDISDTGEFVTTKTQV